LFICLLVFCVSFLLLLQWSCWNIDVFNKLIRQKWHSLLSSSSSSCSSSSFNCLKEQIKTSSQAGTPRQEKLRSSFAEISTPRPQFVIVTRYIGFRRRSAQSARLHWERSTVYARVRTRILKQRLSPLPVHSVGIWVRVSDCRLQTMVIRAVFVSQRQLCRPIFRLNRKTMTLIKCSCSVHLFGHNFVNLPAWPTSDHWPSAKHHSRADCCVPTKPYK